MWKQFKEKMVPWLAVACIWGAFVFATSLAVDSAACVINSFR